MMTSTEIMDEAKQQGATLELLPGRRLGLRGGDTRLRAAIDHHLPALLWLLSRSDMEPPPPADTPRPGRPWTPPHRRAAPPPQQSRRPLSRACLDCTHHRPPNCVALGIKVTRNRAHRCQQFEPRG